MRSIARILVLALSLLASMQAVAQSTSEAAVREFLARLDSAIAAKNVAEVGKLLSENAQFSGTISAGGRTRTINGNKAQYVAALKETWAQASNYIYRRSNQEILVSGAKAIVTADVFESMIVQGQYVAVRAKEVLTLEQSNGVLLVTDVVAKGTMRGAQ